MYFMVKRFIYVDCEKAQSQSGPTLLKKNIRAQLKMKISKSVCIVEQQWIKCQFCLRNNPLSRNRDEDTLINIIVLPLKFYSIVTKYLFINIYFLFFFFGGGVQKVCLHQSHSSKWKLFCYLLLMRQNKKTYRSFTLFIVLLLES